MTETTPLKPKISLKSLLEKYNSTERHQKMHALIVGDKGVGKTSLLKTCPKPVLVFGFDPGGLSVLKKEIAAGDIIPVDLENENPYKPTAFVNYQTRFNEIGNAGIFNEVATVAIDTITTMSDCIISQILSKEGRMPPAMNDKLSMKIKTSQESQGMRIQDWGTVLTVWLMLARDLAMLPCHTILLGHMAKNRDDITGGLVRGVLLPGQAKDKVPVLLHEYYVLLTQKAEKQPVKRVLLTQHDSYYDATTRMGGGIFDKFEKPDIRFLLEKAGYPAEDKT